MNMPGRQEQADAARLAQLREYQKRSQSQTAVAAAAIVNPTVNSLEKENAELRRQLLILKEKVGTGKRRYRRNNVPISARVHATFTRCMKDYQNKWNELKSDHMCEMDVIDTDASGKVVKELRTNSGGTKMWVKKVKRLGRKNWAVRATSLVSKISVLAHTGRNRDKVKMERYEREYEELFGKKFDGDII